jgi:ABC-2 type transport system permease protein
LFGVIEMKNLNDKSRLWISSGAGTALVVAILVMINAISNFAHFRMDLSRNRIYSISQASRRIIRGLSNPVLINVYYSKELPPQIASTKNYLRDILKEYISAAKGNLRIRLIELGDDPAAMQDAINNGIKPVFFDFISKEKFEHQRGVLGLTVQYLDKKEIVPFIQGMETLEYDLTSRIVAVSSKSKPVLGFVNGYQAQMRERLYPSILNKLQTRYEVRNVDLSAPVKDGAILPGIDILFFIGPQSRVPDEDIAVLKKYIQSGRSLCLALDRKHMQVGSYVAAVLDTGLDDLLKSLGLARPETLVFDEQSMAVQIPQQQGSFKTMNMVQYPPVVIVKDLDEAHAITHGLDSLVLPFVSPIEISKAGASIFTVLARSSMESWAAAPGRSAFQRLDPFNLEPPDPKDLKGPFVLAVASQGPPRLVVIGTSRFAGTGDFRPPESNEDFFLNIADWLSQDVDLISIRSKTSVFHLLREASPLTTGLIHYTDLFLPPFAMISAGLMRLQLRRRRRRRVLKEYA